MPEVAPPKQEHCQPCQHFHSAMAPSPVPHSMCVMGRGTMPCGTARGGICAQVAQQGSQETQTGPLPHKALGTEKHLHCIPFCAVTWNWESGVNPRTLLQSISRAPSPTLPTHRSPESFCFSGRQNPSPKNSTGDPMRVAREVYSAEHPKQL